MKVLYSFGLVYIAFHATMAWTAPPCRASVVVRSVPNKFSRTILKNQEDASLEIRVSPPVVPVRSPRAQTTKSVLGTMGTSPTFWAGKLAYIASIVLACRSAFASPIWFLSLMGILLTSYAMAKPALPIVYDILKLDNKEDFVVVFSAHLASATALPILTSMLWNHVASKKLLLISMLSMTVGSIAEIIAHFRDGWVFGKGGYAESGVENVIFSIGLNAAFGLLAASFFPSPATIIACNIPAVMLVPFIGNWKKSKKVVYASQSLSSGIAMTAMALKFRSPWPLLFFVQSFNVVRNAGRILKTGIQPLHICPSLYGWFSYVVPFGLSIVYAGAALNLALPAVAVSAAASVFATAALERTIVSRYLEAHPGYTA